MGKKELDWFLLTKIYLKADNTEIKEKGGLLVLINENKILKGWEGNLGGRLWVNKNKTLKN